MNPRGLRVGLVLLLLSVGGLLASSGTVVTWLPSNQPYYAPLTNYATINQPQGLTNVTAVAAGAYHNVVLRDDGTVVAWGDNSSGQTNVPVNLSNVVAIAAGGYRSLAVKNDGTVVGWGDVTVPELTNIVAVSAGATHCLALKNDGSVIAWGSNTNGETDVPAGLSNVIAIAAGGDASLALLSNGTIIGWGGTNLATVPVGLSNVVSISVSPAHALAVRNDGAVFQWGAQVGQGGVQGTIYTWPAGIVAIAAGVTVDLALGDDSTVHDGILNLGPGWGSTTGPWSLPLSQRLTNVLGIATGNDHYLVITRMPVILRSPVSQTNFQTLDVSLNVVFESSDPVTFQWSFVTYNPFGSAIITPLAGATNASLVIPNISTNQAGDYVVALSNSFGSIVSQPAHIGVLSGPPFNRMYNVARDTNGNFLFTFAELTNSNGYDIESSTNLQQWEPAQGYVAGVYSSGSPYVTAHAMMWMTNSSRRFYRLKARP